MSNKFIVALWGHEEVYVHAVETIRTKGIKIYNTFTPFAVHGLEDAMGYRDSRLHTASFWFGLTGTTLAVTFMGWCMAVNYPLNIDGKPNFPLASFIPIMFEITVLFAAWGMTLTYLVRNQLFPWRIPRIYDKRTTDDRFALVFDAENLSDAELNNIRGVCKVNGALEIKDRLFTEHDEVLNA